MATPPKSRRPHTLDVRPLIAAGDNPFATIMAAIENVGPGESLVLVTPFLPSPLIERLHSDGFTARPERSNDGSWRTSFRRE